MNSDFISVFQNLAFPVACCCVLFAVLFRILKNAIDTITVNLQTTKTAQVDYINYLQKANADLVNAVRNNTEAIQRFSILLDKLTK